ncbi:MAG: hypothetical protein M1114_01185 [Candidatus Dependentiae bacterium]|nr:hypothetical protein [Candidatus Dependentiae bacterium]
MKNVVKLLFDQIKNFFRGYIMSVGTNNSRFLFVIDEACLFQFRDDARQCEGIRMGYVAGIALAPRRAKDVLRILYTHYFRDGSIIKGYKVDDAGAVKFIDSLSAFNCDASFALGDTEIVSLTEASQYLENFKKDLINYLHQDHPEYQCLTGEGKQKLLKDVTDLIQNATKVPQEFMNLLMIFEVIIELLQKTFDRFNNMREEPTGIDIIIDTQNPRVAELIKKDFFKVFLFAVTRRDPFNFGKTKFTNVLGGKRYLNMNELLTIKTISDKEAPIICGADFIVSFTSKVLRGKINNNVIVDKLYSLYGEKAEVNHFHPTEKYKFINIPSGFEYAYYKLVKNFPFKENGL